MKYNLTVTGFDELQRQLVDVVAAANVSMARVLNFAVQSTAIRAKNAIRSGPRSGNFYEINGRVHQASAPGEPPANLTGALAQSIRYTLITNNPESGATVGSTIAYAQTLEFGGFAKFNGKNIYIEPRPFLLPAYEAAIAAARSKFASEFTAAVRKVL